MRASAATLRRLPLVEPHLVGMARPVWRQPFDPKYRTNPDSRLRPTDYTPRRAPVHKRMPRLLVPLAASDKSATLRHHEHPLALRSSDEHLLEQLGQKRWQDESATGVVLVRSR